MEDLTKKLTNLVKEMKLSEASDLYVSNFKNFEDAINKKDISSLNAVIDFSMAVRRFKKAERHWIDLQNIAGSTLKFHRFVKMIRCFYFSGNVNLAHHYITDYFDGADPKDKALLIAVMTENGDEKYLEYLGVGLEGYQNSSFFNDRLALFKTKKEQHLLEKKTLFVSGTPRSGTTALGAFLNHHDDICITTERFGATNGYCYEMLKKDNIFSSESYKRKYSHLYSRYEKANFIGDKRPNFLFSWDLTKQFINGCNNYIIHLIRDPYLVAQSYYKRAVKQAEGNDVWSSNNLSPRDQYVACIDYNINNRKILELVKDKSYKGKVIVLNSDRLYSDKDNLLSIFNLLSLDVTDKIVAEAEKLQEKSKAIQLSSHIDSQTIDIVEKNFDFNLMDKVSAISLC